MEKVSPFGGVANTINLELKKGLDIGFAFDYEAVLQRYPNPVQAINLYMLLKIECFGKSTLSFVCALMPKNKKYSLCYLHNECKR